MVLGLALPRQLPQPGGHIVHDVHDVVILRLASVLLHSVPVPLALKEQAEEWREEGKDLRTRNKALTSENKRVHRALRWWEYNYDHKQLDKRPPAWARDGHWG